MNTPIEDFAQAPQRDRGYYTHNNEVADEIFKFLEEESPVREFCTPKPMVNVLSKTYIVEHEEGTAYQVVGNAEVPRAEDVSTQFTVFLHRNATGYKIDDDQRRINSDDPQYEAKKMKRAMERLLKKENKDILNVMLAGAQTVTQIPASGAFDVETIADTVAQMVVQARNGSRPMQIQPDVILMPYEMFVELQKDPKFQYVPEIYQHILLEAKLNPSGNRGFTYGDTGQQVAGLRIITMNELSNTAIIMDTSKEALWLAEDQAPKVTKYRDDEHITDIVDIRHDEQPVCVFPECFGAIKK